MNAIGHDTIFIRVGANEQSFGLKKRSCRLVAFHITGLGVRVLVHFQVLKTKKMFSFLNLI